MRTTYFATCFVLKWMTARPPKSFAGNSRPPFHTRTWIVPELLGRRTARRTRGRPIIPERGRGTARPGRTATATGFEGTVSYRAEYVAGAVWRTRAEKRPFLSSLAIRTGVSPRYGVIGAPFRAGTMRPWNLRRRP